MPVNILSEYFKYTRNSLRRLDTGRAPTDAYFKEVYSQVIIKLMAEGHEVPINEFNEFVQKTMKTTKSATDESTFEFATCEGPREWCLQFMARHGLDIYYDKNNPGRRVDKGMKADWDHKEMEKIAMLELHAYNYESMQFNEDGKKAPVRDTYGKDQIKDTLSGLPAQIEKEKMTDVRDVLRYSSEKEKGADVLIKTFMKSLGAKGSQEFNMALFKHWLWQVKQFLYGRKVEDPLFLNLYSTQGTGKSTFIRGLYSPLDTYTIEAKVDAVKTEGYAKIWSSKYIVYFDELRVDSSDRAEMYSMMSSLKYTITMDTNMYRMYHTQDIAEKTRTFSALSSSNVPLSEILYDPSGMRRFIEIECEADKNDQTYKKLPFIFHRNMDERKKAEIIYKNLWRGIDENREQGYLDDKLRKELSDIQSTYKRQDCVEVYEIYVADKENPLVALEDTKSVDKLNQIASEANSRSKFIEDCMDSGFEAKSIKDYRSEIIDFLKEDGSKMAVFGLSRMPSVLSRNHGYLVMNSKQVPYVFRKIENTGTYV